MRHHKWESSYHEINEKGQLESINLIQLDLYNVEKGLLEPKSWSRFLRVAFKCIWDWMVFGGATRTSTFDDCEKTFPFINWINFYTIKPITPTTIVVVATFRMLERFSPKLDRGFLVVYQLFIHSKFLLLKGEANPFSHDRARCSLIAVVVSDASAAPLCSPSCARRVLSLRGSGFSPNFRPRCTPPLQVSRSRTCDGSPYRDRETTVRWNGVAAATGSAFECRPARTSQYLFHFSFRRFFLSNSSGHNRNTCGSKLRTKGEDEAFPRELACTRRLCCMLESKKKKRFRDFMLTRNIHTSFSVLWGSQSFFCWYHVAAG